MAAITVHQSTPGTDFEQTVATLNQVQAAVAELQATVAELVTLANEVKADYNLTLAKLDADAGITDTDYAATNPVAASDATALALSAPDTVVLGY